MQFATLIWCAVAHSWASLVASRVLSAFASSCGEAVTAMVVKDLFFLHERGWWMGLYMFFFQSLGALGVIISGFVITGAGWRWHFWVKSFCRCCANSFFSSPPFAEAWISLWSLFFSPKPNFAGNLPSECLKCPVTPSLIQNYPLKRTADRTW